MSSVLSASASTRSTSEWASTSLAASMVWSDLGLSCLDYPLNRKNLDTVCSFMSDLPFPIVAVWLVARPINGDSRSKFEHWAVKMQAPPALITLDFLESKKKGVFGLQQTTASDAELELFLQFKVRNKDGSKTHKPWNIVSSVTPSPLHNVSYAKCIDEYDLAMLKSFIMQRKSNSVASVPASSSSVGNISVLKHIEINKRVCDLADFLCMWTDDLHKKGKAKTYNAITANCQHFAADLFAYLVGQKKEFEHKVQQVKLKLQSPYYTSKYNIDDRVKQSLLQLDQGLNSQDDDSKTDDNVVDSKCKEDHSGIAGDSKPKKEVTEQ